MIKLSMVAFSSQHQCSVTPEGLKEALLGPDLLGLGGEPPIPLFMQKMFEQNKAQQEEAMADPRPKSTCLSCASRDIPSTLPTPVAVTITVHQAPTSPGVPMHSPAVGRIMRQHPKGTGRHEERELTARTPVATKSRTATPTVQYVGTYQTGL